MTDEKLCRFRANQRKIRENAFIIYSSRTAHLLHLELKSSHFFSPPKQNIEQFKQTSTLHKHRFENV